VQSVDGLLPDTSYSLYLCNADSTTETVRFITKKEFVTLNVKDFGAKGDGIQDDTVFIQSAVSACPADGRVLVPKGTYKVTSIFLKSNMTLELAEDAVLSAMAERERFPVLPGLIESYDESEEYNLGTWEGNPLDMFAAVLTGVSVSDITICGQGTLDGNAGFDNWWKDPKRKNIAYRPRMIFLKGCDKVTVQGITIQNSPSWCIHPYFSTRLTFADLIILNPKDSPNTDGINPESCKKVEITGVYFSLGDDCIAIKSGKLYMGSKYRTASEEITIRQCYMKDGHGAVTIGSEMAGGVKNVTVRDCRFSFTDRGFRLKTRRGRGKDGVIDGILFDNILMEQVLTPIAINSFYYCDPDGHSDYVSTKKALPVDEGTPVIRHLAFRNITCRDCHVTAAFIYGLPEKKIEKISLQNIRMDFAKHPLPGIPAMMDGLKPVTNGGIFAANIVELEIVQVIISGYKGKGLKLHGVEHLYSDNVSDALITDERKEQV